MKIFECIVVILFILTGFYLDVIKDKPDKANTFYNLAILYLLVSRMV